MIRCVRLWTGEDMASHFEWGQLDMGPGPRTDLTTRIMGATSVSLRETAPGGTLTWHPAPVRQLVLTLRGTLRFEMRDGSTFILTPGVVLLAEDTTGSGHRWDMIGEEPWHRAYVVLPPGEVVPFQADPHA